MENSEKVIVQKIVSLFHELAEEKGPLKRVDKELVFDFTILGKKYKCMTERELSYNLPNKKTLDHKTDIFIIESENISQPFILNPNKKFVMMEVKHKSARTDSFKSRSYDMMHLRSTYHNCFGIMMYIREGDITPQQAKKICYPYHRFFSCSKEQLSTQKLSPLFDEIVSFLKEQ